MNFARRSLNKSLQWIMYLMNYPSNGFASKNKSNRTTATISAIANTNASATIKKLAIAKNAVI